MMTPQTKAELDRVWRRRKKLRKEAAKLKHLAGDDIEPNGSMYAKGAEQFARAEMLIAKGDLIWATKVIDAFGGVTIEWCADGSCILGSGHTFR